jgi:hypothetical protein
MFDLSLLLSILPELFDICVPPCWMKRMIVWNVDDQLIAVRDVGVSLSFHGPRVRKNTLEINSNFTPAFRLYLLVSNVIFC